MKIGTEDLNLDNIGLGNLTNLHLNCSNEDLVKDIVLNREGVVGLNGAAMVDTGKFTGRSPKDRYIVDERTSNEEIWWGEVNKKISENIFDLLFEKIISYFNSNDFTKTYIFEGSAGADPNYELKVRVIAKKAWQAHFVNNMFINKKDGLKNIFIPDFTIINASDVVNENYQQLGMHSENFIIIHLGRGIGIIGGTEYGGEMKKGIFSVLNYLLPKNNILSMHCSANVDKDFKSPAIFFGLSGTGKTTLSTDPERPLIGDDEHGWSDNGIFNFEGGCYAKVINLSPVEEPDIYNAIRKGALLENVVYDNNTLEIDYSDSSKTENTRVSYPIGHIDNSLSNMGNLSIAGHPKKIIFLTCDAYGVLPPVAKLNSNQAMYHFISGYTAKIAGTERGITEPTATFSPCFGGPFLTLHPLKYAGLLKKKIEKYKVPVYLVNTGWVGCSANSGEPRFSLPLTRKILNSILNDHIDDCKFENDNYFGFQIPLAVDDIDPNLLNPLKAWSDVEEYHRAAKELIQKFIDNYKIYDLGDQKILDAGPKYQ